MDFKDYYASLGVARTATKDEIHKAFRKLARQYHPDVAKDKVNADRKFKEINEAHEVLSDPEKRRQYDELQAGWKERQARPKAQADWQNWASGGEGGPKAYKFDGTGFSDFFEEFFGTGGMYSGYNKNRQAADPFTFARDEKARGKTTQKGFAVRGADVEGDIAVTLEEVFNGSVREVTMRRTRRTGVEEKDTFKVRIPPGVREGQRLRVPAKGDPGMGTGEAGDLFLNIRYALHPQFRAQDDDLIYELELAPWEAVLGAVVHVPTPDGGVTVRIPEGAHAGTQVRVRGRGLPLNNGERGDLLLPVVIDVPEKVGERERQLWQELGSVSGFNPRNS
ncbi:MAG TPA: J domain-containing protein [Opitutales bacterium]|nr:J domain-containing protein [Opitutales bacterium]